MISAALSVMNERRLSECANSYVKPLDDSSLRAFFEQRVSIKTIKT
jgi:hypothetical protein